MDIEYYENRNMHNSSLMNLDHKHIQYIRYADKKLIIEKKLKLRVYQLVIQCQIVKSKKVHTSHIICIEKVVLKNTYIHIYTCNMEKGGNKFEGEWWRVHGRFDGKKKKGKCNYMIISLMK